MSAEIQFTTALGLLGEIISYDYWVKFPKNLKERAEEFLGPFDKTGTAPLFESDRAAQRQAGREEAMADYEKVSASRLALVRELDVALNGENAAIQASLCDIVAQVKRDGLASAIRSALEAAADRFCETYCCIAPLDCLKKHKSCYLRKAIIAPIQETSKALSDLEAQVKL